jgi:hypothetical protein
MGKIMIRKVKEKPPTLTHRLVRLQAKITATDIFVEAQLEALDKRISALEGTAIFHEEHLNSHKKRLKKTEGMHSTIRKCHTKITGYNTINNKSVNFYNKVILRMREIQKDYNALFKKMGSTITFFEKRKAGEDWIPGDPMEEREVDQIEATTSSQLQNMEEKLDD